MTLINFLSRVFEQGLYWFKIGTYVSYVNIHDIRSTYAV